MTHELSPRAYCNLKRDIEQTVNSAYDNMRSLTKLDSMKKEFTDIAIDWETCSVVYHEGITTDDVEDMLLSRTPDIMSMQVVLPSSIVKRIHKCSARQLAELIKLYGYNPDTKLCDFPIQGYYAVVQDEDISKGGFDWITLPFPDTLSK